MTIMNRIESPSYHETSIIVKYRWWWIITHRHIANVQSWGPRVKFCEECSVCFFFVACSCFLCSEWFSQHSEGGFSFHIFLCSILELTWVHIGASRQGVWTFQAWAGAGRAGWSHSQWLFLLLLVAVSICLLVLFCWFIPGFCFKYGPHAAFCYCRPSNQKHRWQANWLMAGGCNAPLHKKARTNLAVVDAANVTDVAVDVVVTNWRASSEDWETKKQKVS